MKGLLNLYAVPGSGRVLRSFRGSTCGCYLLPSFVTYYRYLIKFYNIYIIISPSFNIPSCMIVYVNLASY